MPAGKTHEKINFLSLYIIVLFGLLIFSYLFYDFFGVFLALLFCFGFAFGTYYFGPDLDLPSRPYYRWKMLRFIWKPYQKFVAHRSVWSHGLLIGDVVRVLYLLVWGLPIYLIVLAFLPVSFLEATQILWSWVVDHYAYFTAWFTGIVLASALHIFSDLLSTHFKKRKRKKQSKKNSSRSSKK